MNFNILKERKYDLNYLMQYKIFLVSKTTSSLLLRRKCFSVDSKLLHLLIQTEIKQQDQEENKNKIIRSLSTYLDIIPTLHNVPVRYIIVNSLVIFFSIT